MDNSAIAYPFRILSAESVVNDTVNGNEILVVFDRQNGFGAVFDRNLVQKLLTFELASDNPLTLRDLETKSTWNALTGEAIDGPLTGRNLVRLKSTTVFWFGWKDFHTDTLVYGVDID